MILAVLLVGLAAAFVADPLTAKEEIGFLSDYSRLKPVKGHIADRLYVVPNVQERVNKYKAVYIASPEVFIHPESEYEGIDPDAIKRLTDDFRGIVVEEVTPVMPVADEPGPQVLVMRFALVDLYMKTKITKNPLHWLPLGAAVHYTRRAATDDLTYKTSLVEAGVEAEFLDGKSGEVLAAAVARRGKREDEKTGTKADPASWKDFEAILQDFGSALACRLENTRKPKDQWVDCASRSS